MTFVELDSEKLEKYEEQYFDVHKVLGVTGLFRVARLNIQSAQAAGWFVKDVDIAKLSPAERVKLSDEINDLYEGFMPISQKGRPTDPNA